MNLGSHRIIVLRAVTVEDAYGNPKRDWSTATQTTVAGCSVQPAGPGSGAVSEVTVGRETVVSRWQIYAPSSTDLTATDRVIFDGDTYEVDGDVQRWDFGALSHVVALLRKGDA